MAKTEFLLPMAKILGVTVEEVLGGAKPRRTASPGGKLGQAFDAAARLPRGKQEKIIALLEAFVDQHAAASGTAPAASPPPSRTAALSPR